MVEILATILVCLFAFGLAMAVLRVIGFGIVVLMSWLFERE